MKYDVIIIGSGMAGLIASLKLVKSGKKVALFEKHYILGGYATNFSRKDTDGYTYTFDVSLHSLSGMNDGCPTREILRDLGVNNIEFIKVSEPLILINKNNESLFIPNDADEYKKFLVNRYTSYEKEINELFCIMKKLMFNNDYDPILDTISIKDFLKQFINDDDFIEEFCYLWVYVGHPVDQANAYYTLQVISRYIFGGHYYVRGGSGNFSKILGEHIKANNGDIFLSNEIVKINTEKDKIMSITTRKGDTFFADEFIIASDPNNIFSLIDDNPLKNNYILELNKMDKSVSILQLYIGLDCSTKSLGIKSSHIFNYNSLDSNHMYNNFVSGDVENSSFYLVAYDQLDPTLNKDRAYLNIAVLDFISNWPDRESNEYKIKKEITTNILIDKLENFCPGIKNHIRVTELGTPRTMKRYTNNSDGVIYGFAQNKKQGGLNRLSFKTPFSNAIIVGAWSFPGGGYEGAITSGYLGATRLLDTIKKVEYTNMELIPINKLMDGLLLKFNPENSDGISVIYKFIFDGNDPIYLQIKDKKVSLLYDIDSSENVDIVLKMSHETWQKIAFNQISGENALLDGLVTCEGNLRYYANIPKIFDKDLNI